MIVINRGGQFTACKPGFIHRFIILLLFFFGHNNFTILIKCQDLKIRKFPIKIRIFQAFPIKKYLSSDYCLL